MQQGTPWIYAAAIRSLRGDDEHPPAYRDGWGNWQRRPPASRASFPSLPRVAVETCDTAGILSTAVNLAASIQVTEALKFLTGQPALMRRTLLSFDLWTSERSEISASTRARTARSAISANFTHLAGENEPHITLCGRNSVQIHEHGRPISLAAMRDRLIPHGQVRFNDLLLRFERRTLHHHALRRWSRHHPGHNRHNNSSVALREIYRFLNYNEMT